MAEMLHYKFGSPEFVTKGRSRSFFHPREFMFLYTLIFELKFTCQFQDRFAKVFSKVLEQHIFVQVKDSSLQDLPEKLAKAWTITKWIVRMFPREDQRNICRKCFVDVVMTPLEMTFLELFLHQHVSSNTPIQHPFKGGEQDHRKFLLQKAEIWRDLSGFHVVCSPRVGSAAAEFDEARFNRIKEQEIAHWNKLITRLKTPLEYSPGKWPLIILSKTCLPYVVQLLNSLSLDACDLSGNEHLFECSVFNGESQSVPRPDLQTRSSWRLGGASSDIFCSVPGLRENASPKWALLEVTYSKHILGIVKFSNYDQDPSKQCLGFQSDLMDRHLWSRIEGKMDTWFPGFPFAQHSLCGFEIVTNQKMENMEYLSLEGSLWESLLSLDMISRERYYDLMSLEAVCELLPRCPNLISLKMDRIKASRESQMTEGVLEGFLHSLRKHPTLEHVSMFTIFGRLFSHAEIQLLFETFSSMRQLKSLNLRSIGASFSSEIWEKFAVDLASREHPLEVTGVSESERLILKAHWYVKHGSRLTNQAPRASNPFWTILEELGGDTSAAFIFVRQSNNILQQWIQGTDI